MLKKTLAISFVALCIGTPALGIDRPQDASPSFFKPATAYSSQYFNKILQAYTLQLDTSKADQLPTSYAKVSGSESSFNAAPIAYSPKQYHSILTAYGLLLTPGDVQEKLKTSSYAKVTGDTISFGNGAIAYGSNEWNNIMSAYSLPAMQSTPVAVKQTTAAVAKPGDADGDGVTDDKDACPNTPFKAVVDDRGCWAFANALLFDFDSAVVKEKFATALDKIKDVFSSHPDLKVVVEGHADSTGPEAYNQKLSERRAQAVVKYLLMKGVNNAYVGSNNYGESKPIVDNKTKENRQKNRRAEFEVAKIRK
jgi:outer membrane protein OmpA-like peptidoglycan-associated protein